MSDTKALSTYWDRGLSPFGANAASHTAYTRAERIVVATHLVTNFIPGDEPLRKEMRALSLRALERVLELREGFRAAGPERVNDVIAVLLELSTLFEAANASGFLSQMNSTVLKRACADLAGYLREHEDADDSESIALSNQYFETPEHERAGVGRTSIKDKISIGQERSARKIVGMEASRTKRTREVSGKKTERRETVLKLVRERKRVSVRDLAKEFPGYSEKTIQRELSALAEERIVRKEGERRWSVYVLVG